MDIQAVEQMYAEVEGEFQRNRYPEDFPGLPEMPAGRYFEPDFAALEEKHIFLKSWLSVGHISQLPQPGRYRLFEQLGYSIIVIHGNDGQVRAFKNTCRHRGSALLLEKEGIANRFTCPYHGWGYSPEGQLKTVPESHNFSCLQKAEKSLFQIRCEQWRGFIFVNFDENAGPLSEFFDPIAQQISDFPIDDMIVKKVIEVEIDCNWKTAYDNFVEIYHVNTVHAKTLSPFLESKSFTISLFEGGHGRFVTRKRGGESFFSAGHDKAAPNDFMTRFRDHVFGLPGFPNLFTALDPVGFNWQTFWPKSPNKMIMVNMLMGWKRDDDEDRAFWNKMVENQHIVLAEDCELFPSIQRSYMKSDLKKIVLGFQEQYIHWYHEEMDRKIGSENIPEHFRVKPLLGAFAKSG